MRHRDGTYLATETLRTSLLHDPNVKGIVLNTRDITERKQFEQQLSTRPSTTPSPNLANRALFRDRVLHAIERQERDRKPSRCCSWTSTTSRRSTTRSGTPRATGSCSEVGDRLKNALRAADTAARLGGDEFAILLEDGGEGIQAADVADRIMQMLEEPFALEGKEVFVRASVGIAVSEDAGDGGEEAAEALMRNADVAMYMAKENGQGSLPGLRARDARHRAAAPGAEGRPPARARARGVHPALPAGDRAGLGQDHRASRP